MDGLKNRIKEYMGRFRYAALVVGIGLALMLLPSAKSGDVTEPSVNTEAPEIQSVQQSLEDILAEIQGVGKVRVLLTTARGEQVTYQTDSGTTGTDTVIITDSGKNQQGLVVQTVPPVYLGAVIVCQGGDRPDVKLAIVEAVSDATGLGADKITVLKMK